MPETKIRYKEARMLYHWFRDLFSGAVFFMPSNYSKAVNFEGYSVISEFTTKIMERSELKELNLHRIDNMRQAASVLDGIILKPGQIFSLRKALGNPNSGAAYKTGPTLIKGKLTFTAGGGLCQVSTTLFNAALTAGLKIVEKHNHSVDIWQEKRMIDLGRDAVFAYYLRDLKFQNNLSFPIVLKASVDSERMLFCCSFYADTPYKPDVLIETSVLKKIIPFEDRDLLPGWLVKTMRTDRKNRRITYTHKDYYRPCKKDNGEIQ